VSFEDRPPYDPRMIANELIDLARQFAIDITHLSLQKVVYFLHEDFLREYDEPLCSGHFEAWKHGPVHPQIWSTFRAAGREPIKHHAYGFDVFTGQTKNLPSISHKKVKLFIAAEGLRLLRIPAPRLVGLSHVPRGAWDVVTKDPGGQRVYGARISNELILKYRASRMVSIRDIEDDEEDLYEQPPT
jgi:uncharacterized phage-associated protein